MSGTLPQGPLVTRSVIANGVRSLGVQPGQTIMMHTSAKAIGRVVGGPDTIIDAVLDVLGPDGTLMMLTGWEDDTFEFNAWNAEWQHAYRHEMPAFDPATSRSSRHIVGIVPEYLRTRPGALRSNHPVCSVTALGPQAAYLVADHAPQGFGPGSPLEKLCEIGGSILTIGAPPDTVTVLHYAEYCANLPYKRRIQYPAPMLVEGRRVWVEFNELDSENGITDYPGEDYFAIITKAFRETPHARNGTIGAADAHLYPARDLVDYGARWMETNLAPYSTPDLLTPTKPASTT